MPLPGGALFSTHSVISFARITHFDESGARSPHCKTLRDFGYSWQPLQELLSGRAFAQGEIGVFEGIV
jgi:hypothetical protein